MTIVDQHLTGFLRTIRADDDPNRLRVAPVLTEALLRAQIIVAADRLKS